ncbi:SWI/SNF complex subunit SWI3D isoform X2 [Cajanus cajan]|uniref:SWI/SNF complex subunit SWI3D isoform X2 n=1 Tax=Cajanus cajan TaxID=3821 RepID=UPI00098D9546|nr:SWI/SNF complex subunit SWI3D isoform X2 [Cajanus cajan]
MEEKRVFPPSNAADSPAPEPASSRRRAATQKRKANALSASNSSSTPSKRISRDKALPPHTPPFHNGPLTRARQIPAATASGGAPASAPAAAKQSDRALDSAALTEQLKKQSEWEALVAAAEAQFEAVRSRDSNAHVVPTHCGWFSWTNIHPVEKHSLPSFFNGKTVNRTPDKYMEIRNYIMKRFHANPNVLIELKDLSELNAGDLDARQEVMEFLDYWGLINFHPFPSMGSAAASTNDDGVAEKNSLLDKLYHFESQPFPPIVQNTGLMTPAMTSGLLPDTTVVGELVKQEGPAVEYHCNSCSGDCSRKRYHCQKQADFDLCTNCFSNRKFGSSMSSLDFILMEPAEVPGISGGKWTDQETLLLLEALELYKENWNEIAEHVATKSKAQCILHFVQMPIEDAFVDCGDDVDASFKENIDPATSNNDSSVHKDALQFYENKISDSIEDQVPTLQNDSANADNVNKMKVNHETTPKPGNVNDVKTCEQTSKSEDDAKLKFGQEAGSDSALNALEEAFTSIGYSPGPKGPSSFSEVGNPVMALSPIFSAICNHSSGLASHFFLQTVFLARLVGSDMAVASAHSSLKSMSVNSPGTVLSARHCFLLENPLDDKEPTISERDSMREGNEDDRKPEKLMLDDNALSNDHNDKKHKDNALEVNRQLGSQDDGVLDKSIVLKEQAMIDHEEVAHNNCKDPGNLKFPSDLASSNGHDSNGSTLKDKVSPSSNLREGTSLTESCQPMEELKDGHVSNAPPAENKLQQSIKSNLSETHLQPVETPKDVDAVSDFMPSDKSKSKKLLCTNPVVESLDPTISEKDVDLISNSLPLEKNGSQSQVTSISSQHTVAEKDVDMMSSSMPLDKNELPHRVKSNSGAENGYSSAGGDRTENGTKVKDDGKKEKHDNSFEKLKKAAVSTLAAAVVKAKILAEQEEDQIRQLASLLIEKQLHKLETKLAFFHDMENVVMRVREYLVQSRQKLYHERALIIASRLGLPASSSKGVPPNLPINRSAMNLANSVPKPQIIMNPQRPPISGPVGTIAAIPNHLASAATVGNSAQPSSQESLSSVGIK